ncbi:hypothetical protein Hypma_014207 [Hypsizygus marmoreus]|uniref:Uncharacterized protein n=1 Tax=Hypsizygus marmoreus TaxID=39966 RepID=A0A369JHH2_HYPMA|nr:hypothetical protein Hypma_014207 [Hypsizygus marmoreus]
MTQNQRTLWIQDEVEENMPPYSHLTVDAFFIGDHSYDVPIVKVPPDIGCNKAVTIDHLAFDIWVKPHNMYSVSIIDMTNRFLRVGSVLTKDGKTVPLENEYTICYAEQVRDFATSVNITIHRLTGGCVWLGNLLILKHGLEGDIVDVVEADLVSALAAAERIRRVVPSGIKY